jgi:hypothetical protein
MLANKVFEVVLQKDLPSGTKLIDSIWAMKKKNSSTLCGQRNAKGFKQVEGQHYNGTTISSPVTNSATIRINKLLSKLPLILLCTIRIDDSLFDCRFLPQQGRGGATGSGTWLGA